MFAPWKKSYDQPSSVQLSSVAQSSLTLRPHATQHARPRCPSPTPGVHPNPCPLSQWGHPTISSSVVPFSSCPQSVSASGSFQMSQLFGSGGQSIGRKVMTNLDSTLKSRDITLPTKVHLIKAMIFPVIICGFRSWTIKKAEHQRLDAFKLCCCRRLLRDPWTASRSNQSFLKEISPEYSLEGLMLKLKLQYFGHLIRRTDSLEKTLMLGKIEGGRRRGQQRARWWDGITDSMDMSPVSSRSWSPIPDKEAWCAAVRGSDMTKRLNWTELSPSWHPLFKFGGYFFLNNWICEISLPSSGPKWWNMFFCCCCWCCFYFMFLLFYFICLYYAHLKGYVEKFRFRQLLLSRGATSAEWWDNRANIKKLKKKKKTMVDGITCSK